MTVGRGRGNLTIIWGGRAKGVKNDCWAGRGEFDCQKG